MRNVALVAVALVGLVAGGAAASTVPGPTSVTESPSPDRTPETPDADDRPDTEAAEDRIERHAPVDVERPEAVDVRAPHPPVGDREPKRLHHVTGNVLGMHIHYNCDPVSALPFTPQVPCPEIPDVVPNAGVHGTATEDRGSAAVHAPATQAIACYRLEAGSWAAGGRAATSPAGLSNSFDPSDAADALTIPCPMEGGR